MFQRTILSVLFFFGSCLTSMSMDMNVAVNKNEKLVYVNMWGPIQQGDELKFKSLVLPYVRAGYIIFQVNIFSGGGSVSAAIDIGEQIRTLQARTVTAYNEAKIHNNQRYATGNTSCMFYETAGDDVQIKPIQGYPWCTCASACFLIWISGATRQGGRVGIHRITWSGNEFGQLSVLEAREQYARAESDLRAYVSRLNVPATIVDRMFATGSREIHFLSWPDLQLIQSTPYLEEFVLARCGPSKHQHMSRANNWTSTSDPQHVDCYRATLKELMLSGAKVYLQKYGN